MSFPLVGRDAAAARQAERFFDAADVAESGRAARPCHGAACAKRGSTLTGSKIWRNCGGSG